VLSLFVCVFRSFFGYVQASGCCQSRGWLKREIVLSFLSGILKTAFCIGFVLFVSTGIMCGARFYVAVPVLTMFAFMQFLALQYLSDIMSPIKKGESHPVDDLSAYMSGQMSEYDKFMLKTKIENSV